MNAPSIFYKIPRKLLVFKRNYAAPYQINPNVNKSIYEEIDKFGKTPKYQHDRINKNLSDKQFAIWRVDAPWLPRTKKPQGTRLGGGRGPISHYLTPVKSKRIILELGGHITEMEARAYLSYLFLRFSFAVEFVSQELLDKRRELAKLIETNNANTFNWDKIIKYNMQECYTWLSPYDIIWKGKYK